MRLVSFASTAGAHAGIVADGGIVDLTSRTGVPSVRRCSSTVWTAQLVI